MSNPFKALKNKASNLKGTTHSEFKYVGVLNSPPAPGMGDFSSHRSYFNYRRSFHHGYPPNATCCSFDSIQQLLVVGTSNGSLKIFGRPPLELLIESSFATSPINWIFSLHGEGAFVSISNKNSLSNSIIQIWDMSKRKVSAYTQLPNWCNISSCYLGFESRYLYIGLNTGWVIILSLEVMKIVKYMISPLDSGLLDKRKIDLNAFDSPRDTSLQLDSLSNNYNGIRVAALTVNPVTNGLLLIGFKNGIIIIWNVKAQKVHCKFFYEQKLKDENDSKVYLNCSAWSLSGNKIACGYSNGQVLVFSLGSSSNTPEWKMFTQKDFSNLSEKPVPVVKILWNTKINKKHSDTEELLIFGGTIGNFAGLVSVSGSDFRERRLIGSFDQECLDFTVAAKVAISIVKSTETIRKTIYFHSLDSNLNTMNNRSMISFSGFDALCETPIIIMKYFTDISDEFSFDLEMYGEIAKSSRNVSRDWPVQGGTFSEVSILSNTSILLTAHFNGRLIFWDVSSVSILPLYICSIENFLDSEFLESIGKVNISVFNLCHSSRQLVIGLENGYVFLFCFGRTTHDGYYVFNDLVNKKIIEKTSKSKGIGYRLQACYYIGDSKISSVSLATIFDYLAFGTETGEIHLINYGKDFKDSKDSSFKFSDVSISNNSDKSSEISSLSFSLININFRENTSGGNFVTSDDSSKISIDTKVDDNHSTLHLFIGTMKGIIRVVTIEIKENTAFESRIFSPKSLSPIRNIFIVDENGNPFLMDSKIYDSGRPDLDTENELEIGEKSSSPSSKLFLVACCKDFIRLYSIPSFVRFGKISAGFNLDSASIMKAPVPIIPPSISSPENNEKCNCDFNSTGFEPIIFTFDNEGYIQLFTLYKLALTSLGQIASGFGSDSSHLKSFKPIVAETTDGRVFYYHPYLGLFRSSLFSTENILKVPLSLPDLFNPDAQAENIGVKKDLGTSASLFFKTLLGKMPSYIDESVIFSDLDTKDLFRSRKSIKAQKVTKDKENSERKELFGDRGKEEEEVKIDKHDKVNNNTSEVKDLLGNMKNSLYERGEKLEKLQSHSEELEHEASNWLNSIDELVKQQENKKWYQ